MENQSRKKNTVVARQSILWEADFETVGSEAQRAPRAGEEPLSPRDVRRGLVKPATEKDACTETIDEKEKDACAARRSAEIGEMIGKELRNLYDDVVAQPVPDRFLDLLNQLESKPISPVSCETPGKK